MVDDSEPVIVDLGSGHMKAGYASDDSPKFMIPMVIGKPKNKALLVGMEAKDSYIGAEAKAKRDLLEMRSPIEAGVITSVEAVQEDIKDMFMHLMNDEMIITGEEHNFMITEPPQNPKEIREELVDLM